jgi:hypothetical protein
MFWMPPAYDLPGQADQVRHDAPVTFYESVNNETLAKF